MEDKDDRKNKKQVQRENTGQVGGLEILKDQESLKTKDTMLLLLLIEHASGHNADTVVYFLFIFFICHQCCCSLM